MQRLQTEISVNLATQRWRTRAPSSLFPCLSRKRPMRMRAVMPLRTLRSSPLSSSTVALSTRDSSTPAMHSAVSPPRPSSLAPTLVRIPINLSRKSPTSKSSSPSTISKLSIRFSRIGRIAGLSVKSSKFGRFCSNFPGKYLVKSVGNNCTVHI